MGLQLQAPNPKLNNHIIITVNLIPSFSSYTICNCCSREWCSHGRPIRSKDDINCCCRFCFPLCTVLSLDGCGASAVLAFFAEFWYTMFCWEPLMDEEIQGRHIDPMRQFVIHQAPRYQVPAVGQ